MKRIQGLILAVLILVCGMHLRGCEFSRSKEFKVERNTAIPGPGMPGYDAELENRMDLYYRQFVLFNGAAYGVGQSTISLGNKNDTDKGIVNRYFNQYPAIESFSDFCAADSICKGTYNALLTNPLDPQSKGIFWSVLNLSGMHGGTAMVGDLARYAVLRDHGYKQELVEAARTRAIHQLEVLDIANSIAGVPGVMAYNLRRKDHEPPWDGGKPLLSEPPTSCTNYKIWHEDNTADKRYFDEWAWCDTVSKDQADGWLLAMGVAWDVISGDPTIPQKYKDMLQTHARNFARRLMEVAPEFGVDMVLRDANGRLTKDCDVNPQVMVLGDGCCDAEVSEWPVYPFNAIMGLGFIRTCLHIAGDKDIQDFYYNDLIGKRRWHEYVRDTAAPISDFGYSTNYSNVNMAFIAFYNAIRYETDPEVRYVLQQGMEKLWDNGRNHRQPKHINQPFFDVIYSGLRFGGNVPDEVAEGIQTLKEWPYPPVYWEENVLNCDRDELAQGRCLAVDNTTIIELPSLHDPSLVQSYSDNDYCTSTKRTGLGHSGDTIVAEHVVPRRLRGPSNNDWRSDPFEVNRCGNPYEVEAVPDIMAAYWLGRFLVAETAP